MTAVGSLEFSSFAFYVTWPLSSCYSGLPCKLQNVNEIRQSAGIAACDASSALLLTPP